MKLPPDGLLSLIKSSHNIFYRCSYRARARARIPLALPPGMYSPSMLRLLIFEALID